MTAVTHNFIIEQGATLSKVFVWKDSSGEPVNLTGYVARIQSRPSARSETVYINATTENGKIVIDAANGKVTLNLSSTETAAFDWISGVYDLELEDSTGIVTRLVQGLITVSQEVTR